jgi:hypothetical protein
VSRYIIRSNPTTIKLYDGFAAPVVTVRCESVEWADRMLALLTPLTKEETAPWVVTTTS